MLNEIILAPVCSKRVKYVSFWIILFRGAGGGISCHPGEFIAVLFAKDKYISQMRGIYTKLDLILMKKNGHHIH